MNNKQKLLSDHFDHKKLTLGNFLKIQNDGFFNCFNKKTKSKKISMILPPPNVTGVLHIGHALNISIADAIVRYHYLMGYDVNWIAGLDHAGIATQAKFENEMRKKNIDVSKLAKDRKKFIEEISKWADVQKKTIIEQANQLAACLDWNNAYFTLDKKISVAVNDMFISLYKDKLIYRAQKLLNWDPKLETAISNIEIVYKKITSSLYYINYHSVEDSSVFLTVATTRPETMFGDVSLFVNPNDNRYKKYINKMFINPVNNQKIPVMADAYVDMNFGTGVMKCTPGHDFNDYKLGIKYKLPVISVMDKKGNINEKGLSFSGMSRFECREKLVQKLKNENKLFKIEKINNEVGFSERSDVVVEPMISEQWFIKTKPIIKKVISLQNSNQKIQIFPKRFNNDLKKWLNNMEDWCISRQLVWGHRLPVYYHKITGKIKVGKITNREAKNYVQDSDVLDTWFSSTLLPFVCFQNKNGMNKSLFPNTLLVTGFDIIFFWVARMMLMSVYKTNKLPFKNLLITGLIRDENGKKMSKSLGNGIDPRDVIDQYGLDAMRLFLISQSTPGEDISFQNEKLKRNVSFLNKLWNAARFILEKNPSYSLPKNFEKQLSLADKWILSRLNFTYKKFTKNFEKYLFSVANKYLYDFIYGDFCGIYVEISKYTLLNKKTEKSTKSILYYVLQKVLLMLHPQCPLITEYLYKKLTNKKNILNERFLLVDKKFSSSKFEIIIQLIKLIRTIRKEKNISFKNELIFILKSNSKLKEQDMIIFNQYLKVVNAQISLLTKTDDIKNLISYSGLFGLIYCKSNINQYNDSSKMDLQHLKKRLSICEFELERASKLISNKKFLENAPKQKVNLERKKVNDYTNEIKEIKKLISGK